MREGGQKQSIYPQMSNLEHRTEQVAELSSDVGEEVQSQAVTWRVPVVRTPSPGHTVLSGCALLRF